MSTTPDDRLVDGESADEPEKDAEATRGVGGSERAGGPSAGSDAEADLPDEARRAIDELVAEATSRRKGRGALGVVAVAAAFVLVSVIGGLISVRVVSRIDPVEAIS